MRFRVLLYISLPFLILVSSATASKGIGEFEKSKKEGATKSIVMAPTVSFTFSNNNDCSGNTVFFTSIASGSGPLLYNWDFGDGNSATQQNPTHVFDAFGCGADATFTVSLTVSDTNGSTTVSQIVTVKRRPNVNFIDVNAGFGTPFHNCNIGGIDYDLTVGIDPNSDTCITSYSIAWGDGNTNSNVTFPIMHTYTSQGSFNLVITAIGANGCSTQKSYTVSNSSNPTAGIVTPGGTVYLCLPASPLNFAISNWGTNPPETVYNIDYGDGTTTTLLQSQMEASIYYNASNPSASSDYPIPHTYTVTNCPNPDYFVSLDHNYPKVLKNKTVPYLCK